MKHGDRPVRLAVVGGRRGAAFHAALEAMPERVALAAVCEYNEEYLAQWKEKYPEIRTYTEYSRLLEDPGVDAVLLATPLLLHARQAIEALQAGKHVLSEVIAAHTLEECRELVETVESTGLTYMMAENYCFMRQNQMVLNMAQQGTFGEITFAEGGYLHDCRRLTLQPDGRLAWRGELQRDYNGMNYPTHSLGPVAQWLGIGQTDELETLSTFTSRAGSMAGYVREQFGDAHPGADPFYWKQGDTAVTLIRTRNGAVISLRVDWVSGRPHQMTHYGLQGTRGAYVSERRQGEEPLVWLAGRSPGASPGREGDLEPEWEPLSAYRAEFEHPRWKRWGDEADRTGHGGGDFFVIEEFVSAVREGRRPAIDVYDAVRWSSVFPLSMQSVVKGGQPIPFPRFDVSRPTS
ncbi:Gfo/Idh/MocA family protein [Paenibacillus sp. J31TS4]|uniref:Gfo/Idh/MocA family protein n=1 Tax=Paenibacillus sp. J31TS4 TaxID=2807195 RepID=UPI001BD09D08|nr:Gfo/Idh/MocA family oxidoreductase [Paenibacillus sp. J31TS4]